ncbi:ribosomal protein S16 [Terriglobus roseus DSM 18391]|uniref:Small ribosomal subunit protein bS16 n=1 Tax=Terriglobus roseus (strain DSM 18391 / NRRL B-41598 / KBS 63) TaxID=926566 RepID=I3ZGJ0_TERRK|nr:ribosomal protein S16 [Terriglobus roseus DSM 18391]
MVMIRLARVGATKQPYYRIVVIEKDRARNGRSIEVVGTYNPRTEPATVELKHDRIAYWTGVGAQMSDIVAKLVKNAPAPAAADARSSIISHCGTKATFLSQKRDLDVAFSLLARPYPCRNFLSGSCIPLATIQLITGAAR